VKKERKKRKEKKRNENRKDRLRIDTRSSSRRRRKQHGGGQQARNERPAIRSGSLFHVLANDYTRLERRSIAGIIDCKAGPFDCDWNPVIIHHAQHYHVQHHGGSQ